MLIALVCNERTYVRTKRVRSIKNEGTYLSMYVRILYRPL
jgi:hypothetical protein